MNDQSWQVVIWLDEMSIVRLRADDEVQVLYLDGSFQITEPIYFLQTRFINFLIPRGSNSSGHRLASDKWNP